MVPSSKARSVYQIRPGQAAREESISDDTPLEVNPLTQAAAPPKKPISPRSIVGWVVLALFLAFFTIFAVIPAWDILVAVMPTVIVQGLILGFVIAIIALGYTMVYGVLQLINFAHSEVFATGAVVGFEAFTILQNSPINAYLKLFIALLSAMTVCGLLNMLIERVAYRPLRGASNKLVPLISAIGVSFLLQDLLRLFEEVNRKLFNLSYNLPPEFTQSVTVGSVSVQSKEIMLVVVAIVMLIALNYLVNFTKLGKAIRAVAQDRQTAGLMGINANQMIQLTFLIGGALGGVAGVLYGMQYGTVNAYVGILPGIKSFTAAVLGGIGSIPGAVLGGLVLGLLEQFIGSVLSLVGSVLPADNPLKFLDAIKAEYKDIGAFIVLIIILIFKPAGLLGRATTEKV